MNRLAWFVMWFSAAISAVAAETKPSGPAGVVRLADDRLQIGLDPSNGTIRELIERPQGDNQLADRAEPFALWQIVVGNGATTERLSADQAGTPHVERLAGARPGLRLLWDHVATDGKESLRVEVCVRLGEQNGPLSRWELSIGKPRELRLKHIYFPRLPALKPRADDVLALPMGLGAMLNGARKILEGHHGKGTRLSWGYPGGLSAQCLAYYQPDGLGFYAACDDPLAYAKTFSMWGDPQKQIHFEVMHRPEQEAVGSRQYQLPYAVVLGTFHGDWSTAAQLYRESKGARAWAERGRLYRGQVPDWVRQTGIWVWNRGRSAGVLPPAAELARHAKVPVSVFWHWWHDCAYDAAFPDYLPPREGEASFTAALDRAHQHGLHVLPYMNQRLWGMTTRSWTNEGAEASAVKGPDGKVHPEHYNAFMNAPCAVMCMGTDFWRSKYAGMAQQVIARLKADGIYMDQACCTPAPCFDPRHGHILGSGRYWADGFGLLSLAIRDRSVGAKPTVLAGEHCGEPWLPYLDLMLTLNVSDERMVGGERPWSVIPFFPAIYHTSVICYGSYGSLVYPPYDERWPAEKAPPERLTLLDRKFSGQFCLEQARSFVWGMQPMIPNFLPSQLDERRDEIDYATRLARTRVQALKYVVDGTWLRPPTMDVPQRELDIAKIGTYTKLAASKKRVPVALAGAWRAADGDVGIALASIHDEKLRLRLPIDVAAYGLSKPCDVYRIDDVGRHREGQFDPRHPVLTVDLPPQAGCILEFCHDDKQEAHRKAQHFIDHEQQFHLGMLPTEQSNQKTVGLAEAAGRDLGAAIRMLQAVDADITPKAAQVFGSREFRELVEALRRALQGQGRICFSGCGATGRLSILLEAAWRQAWQELHRRQPAPLPDLENRVLSIMTGGDYALIRSVENFEDHAIFGRRQVEEARLGKGDVLVAISEGGETSSVIGTIWQAVDNGAKVFFVFNNPAPVLARHIERSRQVIEDPRVTKLDLCSGPMAVAGSTRMQATTAELLVVGAALEMALKETLHEASAVDYTRQFSRLLDDLARPEAVAAMAQMIAFEEQLYRRKGLVTYMAQECLLDIFTDTTERSPTFMLPRFRKSDDRVSPPSWAFVKNPGLATPQAWQQVLRRQPRCLDWDVAAYRQMNAPAAILEHPPHLSAAEMLKFVIGSEDDPSRYGTRDNAATLVVLGDESSRLAAAHDPLRTAFDACARPFRQRAVLAIGPMAPPADLAAQRWHVPVSLSVSPLHLWDRLAAKLVLNTVSTVTMARLGRLQSNWMVYVDTTNKKLIDRGARLVAELSGVDYKTACYALHETMAELARSVRPGDERPSAVALTISRLPHAKPTATR